MRRNPTSSARKGRLKSPMSPRISRPGSRYCWSVAARRTNLEGEGDGGSCRNAGPRFDRRVRPVVLIVEDEFLLRWPASEYLRDSGYRVIEASSVSEAMVVFSSHTRVDAVFSDINLQGELTQVLPRAIRNIIPVSTCRTLQVVGAGPFLNWLMSAGAGCFFNPGLLQLTLQFEDQVRFAHGVAEFLGTHRRREHPHEGRYVVRHGLHRGAVPRMRCASGARLRRRAAANRPALLYELRGDDFRPDADRQELSEVRLTVE